MKIREIMTRTVKWASPDDTLQQAAQLMAELDCGLVPVAQNDRLVGMVTDRDIVTRGVALGLGPESRVDEVMSAHVKYVFDDETTADLARNMGALQIRRLPVLDRNKRLVGIVSLGDLAVRHAGGEAALALRSVSAFADEGQQLAL